MSLLKYMELTKQQINSIGPGLQMHVVLGNESCDLDSMVGSLSLAYHYSGLDKYQNHIVVPLMNKHEHLFPIHVENIYLLKKYNIPWSALIFKNMLPLEKLKSTCNLSITLVDHNVLPYDYKFLKPLVTEIIDHHVEDSFEEWDSNVYKQIQLVGSCCTLITSHIDVQESTPEILEMLYDVITYDTIAYREEAGKVKPMDKHMANILENALSITPNDQKQRTERFDQLYNAHKDINKLTSEQLLYKDLKVVGNIYVPGLPMLVKQYLERSDAHEALIKFQFDNKADILVIMGLDVEDEKVTRDLAIVGGAKYDVWNIVKALKKHFSIEEDCTYSTDNISYYTQRDPKLSRKQLIPMLKLMD